MIIFELKYPVHTPRPSRTVEAGENVALVYDRTASRDEVDFYLIHHDNMDMDKVREEIEHARDRGIWAGEYEYEELELKWIDLFWNIDDMLTIFHSPSAQRKILREFL